MVTAAMKLKDTWRIYVDTWQNQYNIVKLKNKIKKKVSILWCSAFYMVQLSHPYMTTGKTIALTRWSFVSKVMSLLFNMLFQLVIAFLPRSKCLNFMAAVTICSDFGAPKIKSTTVSTSICHKVMGPDPRILVF